MSHLIILLKSLCFSYVDSVRNGVALVNDTTPSAKRSRYLKIIKLRRVPRKSLTPKNESLRAGLMMEEDLEDLGLNNKVEPEGKDDR